MNNVCVPFLPAGINNTVLQDLKEIKNIIPTAYSASFTTPLAASSLSAWKTHIQTTLDVYMPLGVNDFSPTTDKPTVAKMTSTRKAITDRPIPSAEIYVASNFADYKDICAAFKGGNYRLFLVDILGNIFGTQSNSTGVVKGFACQLTAITSGFPPKDSAQSFPIFANFLSYDEFENAVQIPSPFNCMELIEAMPVGLSMWVTSAITGGAVNVRVQDRSGAGHVGFVAADFAVTDSSELLTPTVASITDLTNGDYTLNITKATSTPLAAGDMVVIMVKKTVTSIVQYMSNRVQINALA
jgi:hypothetical protein